MEEKLIGFPGLPAGGDLYEKLERERRYGEVYHLQEEVNGFLVEVEFPRKTPKSGIKEELGIPDEMPDYDYDEFTRRQEEWEATKEAERRNEEHGNDSGLPSNSVIPTKVEGDEKKKF